jgi:hypothetical protein
MYIESCRKMQEGKWRGKGEQLKGMNLPKLSILTAGIHGETPLYINLKINNERQDCKKGIVWECTYGKGPGKQRRLR